MSVADPTIEYYHINRKSFWSPYTLLKVGEQFDVGGNSNPYFSFFETQEKLLPVKRPDGSQEMVRGVLFIDRVRKGEVVPDNLANTAFDLLNHFVGYLREIIWENVRQQEFPHLPSRQRCVWLIPSLAGVNYWLSRMEVSGEYQVLRVRVQGRLHKASESFLLGDSEPMTVTVRKARAYWLGIVDNPDTEEIIFEGRVNVIGRLAESDYR